MKKSILLLTKTTYVAASVLILLSLTFCCEQQVQEGITEEEAQIIVEKDMAIWNEGDMAMIDEIIATDYMEHTAGVPEDIVGIDAFKERVTNLRIEFPDFKVTVEELIIKGDRIVWRWIVSGTHTGNANDIPATGNRMEIEGIGILRVVDGKIVERVMYYNQAAQFVQLGFTITPPTIEIEE